MGFDWRPPPESVDEGQSRGRESLEPTGKLRR